jgi:hypothetical protein
MKVVEISKFVKIFDCSHVRSNAFTYKNDPFHNILNDDDPILTIKHLAIVPVSCECFQLKSTLALPCEDRWITVQHNYTSLEGAKIVAQDLLNSVKESATVSPSEIELAELDMELGFNDTCGFSFLFSSDFKFLKV